MRGAAETRKVGVKTGEGAILPSTLDRAVSLVALFAFFLLPLTAPAADPVPPAPDRYFNDYAGVISQATARQLNDQLESFEKATSSQILVALYPRMQSDSSIEDYTTRVARAWRVGQKAKNNGAILFIFVQDRKMRIEVGYGLEGALPDAIAKRIIEEEIKPFFQQGNFDAGVTAGVNAMLQAVRGEYQGTGRTVAQGKGRGGGGLGAWIILVFFALIILSAFRRAWRATQYGRAGRRTSWVGPIFWPGGGGGGGWSSGGGGGGGGGFSGGGGSFGGGGASGSW